MKITASLLLTSISIPEKIAERKIIVYKSRIDQKTIRVTAEKMKTRPFSKIFFMKPKPQEVQITTMDKYFEPYVVVDGNYNIDYSKNWSRNIQVDETMQELTFFGEKMQPTTLTDHLATPCKIIKLTGKGRYKIEMKAHIIFNKQWHEVGLEQLPFVPFEEHPERILNMIDREFGNNHKTAGKEVELLRSKIVHRPKEFLTIHDELFKVSERAVIYKPMYRITLQNIKTKKEATIIIDAITGKTTMGKPQTPAVAKKEQKDQIKVKKPENQSTPIKTTVVSHSDGKLGKN